CKDAGNRGVGDVVRRISLSIGEVTMREKSAAIVRQSEARVLRAFGEEMTILLDGERTAGTLAMWTAVTRPGGGPPPHYHLNEDETIHVIDGRLAFFLNGKSNEVGPGGT